MTPTTAAPTNFNTSEMWRAIAADYGTAYGQPIPKDDVVDYSMAIASLLSDVQEIMPESFQRTEANARINAAKLMLAEMRQAVRAKERSA